MAGGGARGRAGSFVLPQDAIAAGPPPRDTGMNMPPEVEGGTLLASWERTASALLRAPGAGGGVKPAGYGPGCCAPGGYGPGWYGPAG